MTMRKSNIGALKTLNIYPYILEQNLTSAMPPSAMSTGTPQASFTFNASTMIPSFSGESVLSYKPCIGLGISGQNTSGATANLYYQINKNGSTYKTGSNSSIANNYYYTVNLVDCPNDGDIYDFYIWTTNATSGMNYSYDFLWCVPSRVDTGAKNIVEYNINMSSVSSSFTLTGKANASWTGACYVSPTNTNTTNNTLSLPNGNSYLPLLQVNPTLKLFWIQAGEVAVMNTIATNPNYFPFIDSSYYPSTITYRELFLR